MKKTRRYWDELRRLSRNGGDCYQEEGNDAFAFGLRRVADLFADEVDECHTELRQRLAEETLAAGARLVVGCLDDEDDRTIFRDTVDELAMRLRSEDFTGAGWSDEERTALHRKMVNVMCVAVWMLYGEGGDALVARGKVSGGEHYDVDDFFSTYMGASWLTLRPTLCLDFCQKMRFELDEDGRFKPDFLLVNPPIDGDMLSGTDWRLLAALAKYVPLPERVEDIARQLLTVKCAQDFKQVVRQVYGMCATQQERANIVTKPFREALMAFVTMWQPATDDAVYRQCLQVFNE